jgi:mevalonate kinase
MGVRLAIEDADHGVFIRTALHGELYETRVGLDARPDPNGGPLRFLGAAVSALREKGINLRPSAIWVHASLPAGRGFSSSAAFSLGLLDAMSRHAGVRWAAHELAELAFHVEANLLKVPCGRLDPMACVAGAPVFLQWSGDQAPLRRVKVGRPTHLVLGAFPRHRDTVGILKALSDRWNQPLSQPQEPRDVGAVREAISVWGSTATRGARALADGDLSTLGAAMNEAQGAYDRAAVYVPELAAPGLQAVCSALLAAGAVGAKFSGAGGDGSVVALAREARHAEKLAGILRDQKLAVWKVPLEAR